MAIYQCSTRLTLIHALQQSRNVIILLNCSFEKKTGFNTIITDISTFRKNLDLFDQFKGAKICFTTVEVDSELLFKKGIIVFEYVKRKQKL